LNKGSKIVGFNQEISNPFRQVENMALTPRVLIFPLPFFFNFSFLLFLFLAFQAMLIFYPLFLSSLSFSLSNISIFERAALKIGRNFQAHTFWDRYLQLLEAFSDKDEIYRVLDRIIWIPLQQYPRFYDRFTQVASKRTTQELLLSDERADESDRENILKKKAEVHRKTEEDTRKRWTFEEAILISYFHVKALDESQLRNWRNYLDFEEKEGDHQRVVDLYERCLICCALYEEFWIRYARYLSRKNLIQEAKNVYHRALSGFLNKKPSLLVAKALFEEESGNIEVAREILEGVRSSFVGYIEGIVASVNLERRQNNIDKATSIYEEGLKVVDDKFSPYLICHYAKFLSEVVKAEEKARAIYLDAHHRYKDNKLLLSNFLQFELNQQATPNAFQRIRVAFEMIIQESTLSNEDKCDFLLRQLDFISDRCPNLAGYNQVHAEYLRLKDSLTTQKKRSADDDLNSGSKQAKVGHEGSNSIPSLAPTNPALLTSPVTANPMVAPLGQNPLLPTPNQAWGYPGYGAWGKGYSKPDWLVWQKSNKTR